MKKEINHFSIFLMVASLCAMIIGIVGGVGIFNDTTLYRPYQYGNTYKEYHYDDGIIAIAGSCLLIVAVIFYIISIVSKKKTSLIFTLLSAISLFSSSITQLIATWFYLQYNSEIYVNLSSLDWYYTTLSNGIICFVLCAITVVYIIFSSTCSQKQSEKTDESQVVANTKTQTQPTPQIDFDECITQINYFYSLYSANILTEQEFNEQKARIFQNMEIKNN